MEHKYNKWSLPCVLQEHRVATEQHARLLPSSLPCRRAAPGAAAGAGAFCPRGRSCHLLEARSSPRSRPGAWCPCWRQLWQHWTWTVGRWHLPSTRRVWQKPNVKRSRSQTKPGGDARGQGQRYCHGTRTVIRHLTAQLAQTSENAEPTFV